VPQPLLHGLQVNASLEAVGRPKLVEIVLSRVQANASRRPFQGAQHGAQMDGVTITAAGDD
jgi:hypothetical protein